MNNYMKMEIAAISENESFARSAVAAFALSLSPTLTELSDIKTAVSEAVTNCIVHAYKNGGIENRILIECKAEKVPFMGKGGMYTGETYGVLHISVTDQGCGIDDVEQAVTPFFTTLEDEERSGMGFTIMQTFMDDFKLESERGKGTKVYMTRKIGLGENGEIRKRADA